MVKNQRGTTHIIVFIVGILVTGIVGFAAWRITHSDDNRNMAKQSEATQAKKSTNNEPLPLKSIGFHLDFYNATTKRAGDIEFSDTLKKVILSDPIYHKIIVSDFGIQDKRSPNDPAKRNVQPTFILPLGTKVLAPADSMVVKVEKLYSNDWTIWFAQENESQWVYETEHVDNPTVRVGDTVKAGDIVAEISSHDSNHHPGFGVLEIGLLYTGQNQPAHYCPYAYLDASIKDDIGKKFTTFYQAWEEYVGDTTVYSQESYALPGCANLDPVQG